MNAEMHSERLRADLQAITSGWRGLGATPGAWLLHAFVAREGVACKPQALPLQWYRRGIPQHCFTNARLLVTTHLKLTYCEGFVQIPPVPIPIHHAWAVTRVGRVVDITLPGDLAAECGYLGIPFSRREISSWSIYDSSSVLVGLDNEINHRLIFDRCPDLREMCASDVGISPANPILY